MKTYPFNGVIWIAFALFCAVPLAAILTLLYFIYAVYMMYALSWKWMKTRPVKDWVIEGDLFNLEEKS